MTLTWSHQYLALWCMEVWPWLASCLLQAVETGIKKRIKASFLALTFQNYIHVKSSNYFWKSSILLQLPGVNPTTLKSIINISPGFALNSSEICQKAKEKKEKEDRKILPLAMNKWRKKKKRKKERNNKEVKADFELSQKVHISTHLSTLTRFIRSELLRDISGD